MPDTFFTSKCIRPLFFVLNPRCCQEHGAGWPGERRVGYVQDKVRPGTGREGALGYERNIASEHMDKVRPGTGREGGLGRVQRDCVSFARRVN